MSRQVEEKKNKFRDFLKLYGVNTAGKNIKGQSWNDSFADFMQNPQAAPPKKAEESKVDDEAKDEAKADKEEGGEDLEQQRLYVMNLSY